MDISKMDESQYSSFALPLKPTPEPKAEIIEDATKQLPLQNIQEYLQMYGSKVNTLTQKLKNQRSQLQEQRRENDRLKLRLEEVKKFDAVLLEQFKLEVKVKRIKLKQMIFRSFTYLGVEDLIRVSMVCAAFYGQCTEYLSDLGYWKTACLKGFGLSRNLLWLTFIKHQYPRDKEFLKHYTEYCAITNSKRPSIIQGKNSSLRDGCEDISADNPFFGENITKRAEEDKEGGRTERKDGFFECSYTFLSNVDPPHGETSSVIDYSLMNADSARCDPEEIFCPDFLSINQYTPKDIGSKGGYGKKYVKDEIEQILTDMQKIFSFSHYRQGMTFVVCFLHIVMKQNRKDIYRILNVLLEEPYHLKKLYSDDFYLLNLIIFQSDFLLKQKIPDLYFHLKEENVLLHDFMVGWIMTLFACQTQMHLPSKVLLYIWDMFLLHGWRALIAAILTILFLTKDYISSMNYEEILMFYQREMAQEAFDEERFVALLSTFMVEEDQLNDIENLYKVHIATKKSPDTEY